MEHDDAISRPEAELLIRGLDARIAWSTAERRMGRRRRDAQCAAIDAAYLQGDMDFQSGRTEVETPLLLADIPELAKVWAMGWQMGRDEKVLWDADYQGDPNNAWAPF